MARVILTRQKWTYNLATTLDHEGADSRPQIFRDDGVAANRARRIICFESPIFDMSYRRRTQRSNCCRSREPEQLSKSLLNQRDPIGAIRHLNAFQAIL